MTHSDHNLVRATPTTAPTPTMPIPAARQPLMNVRQIAVAAILGGLALIATGLGIQIPGYLPGVNFNIVGTFLTIGTMAAGPLGGIIVVLLESFVSPVGFFGWPLYWPHILFLALVYPRIYKIANKTKRIVTFWAASSFALFFQWWGWFFLYVYVFPFFPNVWTAMFLSWFVFGFYPVFLLIYSIVPSIVLANFPNFVKPEWRFPYAKWIVIAAAVVWIAALLIFQWPPQIITS